MNTKKYYRTLVQVEVLSETPFEEQFPDENLTYIAREIYDGDCSGTVEVVQSDEISGAAMAQRLLNQGSDPGFFSLDEDGNEVEDA